MVVGLHTALFKILSSDTNQPVTSYILVNLKPPHTYTARFHYPTRSRFEWLFLFIVLYILRHRTIKLIFIEITCIRCCSMIQLYVNKISTWTWFRIRCLADCFISYVSNILYEYVRMQDDWKEARAGAGANVMHEYQYKPQRHWD